MSDTALETAPDFTLPSTSGEVSLSALKGAPVVLFFYPRDDTSGCTKENEAFTALLPEFEKLGVKVFGVSKDSIASHEKFMAKKALTVPLISDEGSDMCENYGVWKEKKMYGKTFMGIERSTFLVDAEGRIAQEWRKVKVPGHAEAVLEAAQAL
ncbi:MULTISPECIES: peroxiredoxin [Mameliella]|uniref:thioredoxin-dependent peroxiredoxin n=1 Tax=Mameliella alba TaxID=561184 RepID=A0A0B3S660_9RHOB|nr:MULTISPECIES: peroxiredoxin [Mameliella]MBV6637539.1 peroxiredoxin [Mameliella sp.]ODM49604.1 alkyl hydroperoxide reductase [Ruegeria sp. PBVC088]KHQ52171.1 Peroxiredoxin [Mameliella alba]MBY6120022.1 peroxiredoxin [Mameliella alba]MDD9728569.1 peroxiredoxin [Mameliella sp. AT18]